jgi:cytidine deaminase
LTKTEINEKFVDWPRSKTGRFYVCEDAPAIGHHFCVTDKHVAYAADKCHGILGDEAAAAHPCGICKRPYEDHKEKILFIFCEANAKEEGEAQEELQEYLTSIVERTEAAGYAGFAFVKGW